MAKNKLKHTKSSKKNMKTSKAMPFHKITFSQIHSLKTKFIVALISFALIPFILLCALFTSASKNALKETSSSLNLEIVQQVSNNITTKLSAAEQGLTNLGANTILNSNYLPELFTSTRSERAAAILGISSIISDAQSSLANISDICFVIDGLGQNIGSIPLLTASDIDAILENQKRSSGFMWLLPEKFKTTANNVLITKNFIDLKHNKTYSLFARYNLSTILNYINSLSLLDDSVVYLVDQFNTVLLSSDSEIEHLSDSIINELNQSEAVNSFDTSTHTIVYNTLPNDWKLIVETPIASLTTSLNATLIMVLVFLIIMIVVATVLGYILSNSFASPIINLMKLMTKAEAGDLTVTAPVKGKDEVAQLCLSFNHMIENIKKLINQTQDVITDTLANSETLARSTNHSATTIQELAFAISEIAEGTTSQAFDAQKSTQGMATLASSMENVTKKTVHLITNTDGAKNIIESATHTMHSLTSAMNSSLDITNEICTSIVELNTLNQTIEQVMKLVDNISEETNLLALNASIEAARVGEAGRGFAVVASEVRRLADESKSSTVNVRTTLSTINKKMNDTVNLAEKSRQIIQNQETVVDETHRAFFNIVDILTVMTTELHDIKESIQTMQVLKTDMVSQIDSIASVTQESAASTEEVSSLTSEQELMIQKISHLSEELTQHMESLNQKIQTFKVQ